MDNDKKQQRLQEILNELRNHKLPEHRLKELDNMQSDKFELADYCKHYKNFKDKHKFSDFNFAKHYPNLKTENLQTLNPVALKTDESYFIQAKDELHKNILAKLNFRSHFVGNLSNTGLTRVYEYSADEKRYCTNDNTTLFLCSDTFGYNLLSMDTNRCTTRFSGPDRDPDALFLLKTSQSIADCKNIYIFQRLFDLLAFKQMQEEAGKDTKNSIYFASCKDYFEDQQQKRLLSLIFTMLNLGPLKIFLMFDKSKGPERVAGTVFADRLAKLGKALLGKEIVPSDWVLDDFINNLPINFAEKEILKKDKCYYRIYSRLKEINDKAYILQQQQKNRMQTSFGG